MSIRLLKGDHKESGSQQNEEKRKYQRHSAAGGLNDKARTTNSKEPHSTPRSARTGKFVSQKSAGDSAAGVKGESKADRMFQRAWKDTYEKRERRVG